MKKPQIMTMLSVALFLIAGLSLAQDNDTHSQNRNSTRNIRENVQGKKQEVKTNLQGKKQELKTNAKETREEIKVRTKEATKVFKEELGQELGQKKEELKTQIEQNREGLKTKIGTKREELKKRLEKVKDEKKKRAVERIDRQIDELNDRMLKHYVDVLDKLSNILVKISERTNKAEERGVDVFAVRTAIDAANDAITAAKLTVEVQSSKTYTIQVDTESTLKVDVGRVRQALHDDLTIVRTAVKTAHDIIRNAATTLAQLPRPTPTPKVTESPTPTPTTENQ